jgi:hypothetical protein
MVTNAMEYLAPSGICFTVPIKSLPTGCIVTVTILVMPGAKSEVHQFKDPSGLLKIGADMFPHRKSLATGSSMLAASRCSAHIASAI